MVVFEDGVAKKNHYRNFTIRYEGGQDDFAMMAETIRRRFMRLASAEDGEDASFSSVPDLVMIDGGKGQLGAAVEVLRELHIERVSICSLAKRDEEIYLPGKSSPIVLSKRDPALQLLQRVRDEAHRFALAHHRTRRGHEMKRSILDQLHGIGPARKRALMNFFGSPERIMNASLEELEAVPGIPGKVARSLHDQLHRLAGRAV
jgi:excinuclease ABC subunit C